MIKLSAGHHNSSLASRSSAKHQLGAAFLAHPPVQEIYSLHPYVLQYLTVNPHGPSSLELFNPSTPSTICINCVQSCLAHTCHQISKAQPTKSKTRPSSNLPQKSNYPHARARSLMLPAARRPWSSRPGNSELLFLTRASTSIGYPHSRTTLITILHSTPSSSLPELIEFQTSSTPPSSRPS